MAFYVSSDWHEHILPIDDEADLIDSMLVPAYLRTFVETARRVAEPHRQASITKAFKEGLEMVMADHRRAMALPPTDPLWREMTLRATPSTAPMKAEIKEAWESLL